MSEELVLNENIEEEKTVVNEEKKYDMNNISDVFALLKGEKEEKIKEEVENKLKELVKKYGFENKYKVIYLFDEENSISRIHSDNIYKSLDRNKGNDVLLVLHSRGGSIEPAYLISKTCKKLSKNKFIVTIPRRAKSAATLISLGADEIHMGLMSELGPIDPQINGIPAMGLSNALNVLAKLTSNFPNSSELFAKYLTQNLDLKELGYFERINESASQYAERLLENKKLPEDKNPKDVANFLVNHYKDHSFLIDVDEAIKILGINIVKFDTEEYKFSNEVYEFLYLIFIVLSIVKNKDFSIVGGMDGINIKDGAK